jgi:hypothetical protein
MKQFTLSFMVATLALFTPTDSAVAQWMQAGGLDTNAVSCFAVSGTYLFAGTYDPAIFRSSDSGTSWESAGLMNGLVYDLAVSENSLFAGTIYGVYRSTDEGSSWMGTEPLPEVFALAVSDSLLFSGTWEYGVVRSTNHGTNWQLTSLYDAIVYALATNGSYLFAGTLESGVFRTTNYGTSWTSVGLTHAAVSEFASIGTTTFAGTYIHGVYRSTNSGASWNEVNTGLTSMQVYALTMSGTNLFAGTYGGGVFLSTNNGTSWIDVNSGLANTNVLSLAVSGTNLFAGTDGAGVWRRPLSEMITSIETISADLPTHFSLEQNYPNPFNPTTTISFSLPLKAFASLEVFDALGREVSTLVSEELSAGKYSTQWNTAGLVSGVYFYRLQAGAFVETKKLILLR